MAYIRSIYGLYIHAEMTWVNISEVQWLREREDENNKSKTLVRYNVG
jgi:hypothetical protein